MHGAGAGGAPEASTSSTAPYGRLATVLKGAKPFKNNNVNDTFRGQILLADQTVRSAIIKDLDPQQLANELMVAALARELSLPVPDCFLCLAPTDAMAATKGPAASPNARLVFASADMDTPPVAQLYAGSSQGAVRARLAQWKKVPELYGFDSWIANVDRHHNNLLFDGADTVWMIDHGHCFTGPKWKSADLDGSKAYNNKLGHWLTPAMTTTRRQEVLNAVKGMQALLVAVDVGKLKQEGCGGDLVADAELAALTSFLTSRCSHTPKLAALALGIPILA